MTFYKRNLPHFQPKGYTYFITTRLAGSIPNKIYSKIKAEYKHELVLLSSSRNKEIKKRKYSELQKTIFVKYEKILDSSNHGPKWLNDKNIATIVKDSLHLFDGKYYNLIAYTIMPNHIHIVFTPFVERASARSSYSTILQQKFPVTEIMRRLKGNTALQANNILKRTGTFWQHESYDHVVRDEKELKRIVNYILYNPVKAGLCSKQEDWEWSYYNPKFLV